MSENYFFHATKVVSGCSTITKVGEEIKLLGAKKVLIVTDKFMATSPIIKKIKDGLEETGIAYCVYDDVKPNPKDVDCLVGAEYAKKEGIEALIALGGGSSMDQAKAIGALVTNGGKCQDWDGVPLKKAMLPTICIPTTAGTGSEATFVAVITDTKRKFKMSIFDPLKLVPKVAIIDPEVTISLPPFLTASTGIDALTHAIEAYTCKVSQPITDALALYAIDIILKNIVKAVTNGNDIKAREQMMIGSCMAGIAFINSNVGAVHAISETIGGRYDTPHGVGNSIFLPYVMKYNVPANVEKFATVAKYLGVDPTGKSAEELAYAGVEKVKELNEAVKIPKLSELEYIKEENFEEIARISAENLLSNDNAREIDAEAYLEILRAAYANK